MSKNIKKMAAISAAVHNYIAIVRKAPETSEQLPETSPSEKIFSTEASRTKTIRTEIYPVPEIEGRSNSSWGIWGRQNIMDQRFMMQYRICK